MYIDLSFGANDLMKWTFEDLIDSMNFKNIHEHEYRQSNYVMSMRNNKFSKQ